MAISPSFVPVLSLNAISSSPSFPFPPLSSLKPQCQGLVVRNQRSRGPLVVRCSSSEKDSSSDSVNGRYETMSGLLSVFCVMGSVETFCFLSM
ncbi:hypothetical protein M0R45_005566 [Rubus argutus]|uniref:Uncharacterized protein n=1 Tax=Rubus argutus TaxID=59490 RepID=A0AAW1YN44_RUBAR